MADRAGKKNIVKIPRYPVTLITVVFGLILLYLLVQGILLLTRNRIRAYNIGAAVSDNVSGSFTGIILREENVILTEKGGYVNYYAVQGERLQAGSVTCMLYSEGDLEERLHKLLYGQETLTKESRQDIQRTIREASENYDSTDFSTAALAKANIEATVFHSLLKDGGAEFLKGLPENSYDVISTEESGFIMFYLDGYEEMTADTVTSEALDSSEYAPLSLTNGDHVDAGSFVCKIAPGNQFTIVFPLSDEEASGLLGKKNLSVRMENGLEITGAFEISETSDHQTVGILSFRKYGGNFIDRRYVSFEILDKNVTGFKIPKSALTEKSLFVIDESYVTESGKKNQKGILTEQDGEAVFVPVTAYFSNETNPSGNIVIGEDSVYIYADGLEAGMKVLPVSTGETEEKSTPYILGVTASVTGVYQINNGYCIFKPVAELENSIETAYVIVSAGVNAGLKPFDRIVLDASKMKENQIIFE